jgi:predicted nucleic acid-binding protein
MAATLSGLVTNDASPREAVVCDASVLASIAFGDPHSLEARALIRSKRLIAPCIVRYEMAHIAVRKCAAAPANAAVVEAAFMKSLGVPIRLLGPSWPAVVELARTNGLSAYDASYLQLALALHVPLATLDERLGRAAQALGVRAGPPPG